MSQAIIKTVVDPLTKMALDKVRGEFNGKKEAEKKKLLKNPALKVQLAKRKTIGKEIAALEKKRREVNQKIETMGYSVSHYEPHNIELKSKSQVVENENGDRENRYYSVHPSLRKLEAEEDKRLREIKRKRFDVVLQLSTDADSGKVIAAFRKALGL